MNKRIIVSESEKSQILSLHKEERKKNFMNEQSESVNHNKAIQCFLNKIKVTDDNGNTLKVDGSIGNYPKSLSAQAISKYQSMRGVYPADGVWGSNTEDKMTPEDKKFFKDCVDEHSDLLDKFLDLF